LRFALNVSFPTGKFDQAIADGSITAKMGRMLEETKPEAVYFMAKEGRRGGFLPAITPADLQKADLVSIGKKCA
jgi:hypothetical protein